MRACLLCSVFLAAGALSCSDNATFGDAGSVGGGPGATTGTGATGSTTTGNGGSGGGVGAGGSGEGCVWSAEADPCGEGFYCNAPDCMNGTCEAVEQNDDPVREPVCGCDAVNYWNATTAAAHGMAVASTGECAQPQECVPTAAKPCPRERHFCAQLVANQAACVIDPSLENGVCWGMPKQCPPILTGGTWRPCANEACVDECEAIKGKRKYFPDQTCPQ